MQIKTEIKDICLNGGDIERMVAAMAQQIVQGEGAAASPVLVGLNTKGLAIAKRLARHMALLYGVQPPIGRLEIACGESLRILAVRWLVVSLSVAMRCSWWTYPFASMVRQWW